MKKVFNLIMMTTLLWVCPVSRAATIAYPDIDGLGDKAIGFQILKLILQKTETSDTVKIMDTAINQERAKKKLEDGVIDVMDFGVQRDLESRFEAIYRPLDRGILGWRLFIINKDNAKNFSMVKSIDDLKKYQAAQGNGWGDIKILKDAGLQVGTSITIESIMKMVDAKRFDYFPLGANEVFGFLNLYGKDLKNLEVEKELVLVYPFARLFYVKKGNHKLKAQIEKGMDLALKDGSLQNLLNTHSMFKDAFTKAKLKGRRVLHIASPDLPLDFYKIPPKWWFNPSK